MNENWTNLFELVAILGILILLMVFVNDIARNWLVGFLVKLVRLIKNRILKTTPIKIEMKDGTKNIIAACILALGMIVASIIYAYSSRYTVDMPLRIDKWKGTYQQMKHID